MLPGKPSTGAFYSPGSQCYPFLSWPGIRLISANQERFFCHVTAVRNSMCHKDGQFRTVGCLFLTEDTSVCACLILDHILMVIPNLRYMWNPTKSPTYPVLSFVFSENTNQTYHLLETISEYTYFIEPLLRSHHTGCRMQFLPRHWITSLFYYAV